MQEGWYDDRPSSFMVYAPSRTAVVYALVDKVEEEVAIEEWMDLLKDANTTRLSR